jgi:hypothetical protein
MQKQRKDTSRNHPDQRERLSGITLTNENVYRRLSFAFANQTVHAKAKNSLWHLQLLDKHRYH